SRRRRGSTATCKVETSLQLSIYSYAAEMGGLADQSDVRLRFDVLTKTKQPELHRYWPSRDRAANVRLFRLASEVLHGVAGGGVSAGGGMAVQGMPVQEPVLGVEVGGGPRGRQLARVWSAEVNADEAGHPALQEPEGERVRESGAQA